MLGGAVVVGEGGSAVFWQRNLGQRNGPSLKWGEEAMSNEGIPARSGSMGGSAAPALAARFWEKE